MENNENNVQNQESKKKETKGLFTPLVVIMLIAVLIIGIGGGYLLSKNDNLFNKNGTQSNNNNNNESQSQNTSNTDDGNKGDNEENQSTSVITAGLYQYTQKFEKDNLGIGYFLYLYDNGTFKYEHSVYTPSGVIGEYTIKDNILILNAQYSTASDTDITPTNKTIYLKIDNNTIIYQNGFYNELSKEYSDVDFNNIIMVKANESDDKEYLKLYPSVEYIINQAYTTNLVDYAKEYIKIIEKIETDYPESNITGDFIYFNNDDIPDLVIGVSGYWVSLYIYENGTVYNPVDEWGYGAMGNPGYDYQEKKGVIFNFNTDFAGEIFTSSISVLNSKYEFDTLYFTGASDESTISQEAKKALEEYGGYFYNDQKLSKQEYNNKLKGLSIDIDENNSKPLDGKKTINEIKKELQPYLQNINILDENSYAEAIKEIKKCLKDENWLKEKLIAGNYEESDLRIDFAKLNSVNNTPYFVICSDFLDASYLQIISYDGSNVTVSSHCGADYGSVKMDLNNNIVEVNATMFVSYYKIVNGKFVHIDRANHRGDGIEEERTKLEEKYRKTYNFVEITTELTDENIDKYIK